jgi:hypothetical protein
MRLQYGLVRELEVLHEPLKAVHLPTIHYDNYRSLSYILSEESPYLADGGQ